MKRVTHRLIAVGSSIMFCPRTHPVSAAIVIGFATSMLVASLAYAQGPPPPQYLVTAMENGQGESFRPADINNAGLAVLGKYSNPHLYVSGSGVSGRGIMYDLNHLNNATWIDLANGEIWNQTTTPWIADSATGINESNQIVGTVSDAIGPDRVYVLEDPLGPDPVFNVLPGIGNSVRGVAINDDGVAVGTAEGQIVVFDPRTLPNAYTPVGIPAPVDLSGGLNEPQEINIQGDIVTPGGLVVSPNGIQGDGSLNYEQAAENYFEGLGFYGINDSRQISGSFPGSGRGRDRLPGGTTRFQYKPDAVDAVDRLVADPFISESGDDYFSDVNERGDVAFTKGGRAFVYLVEGLDNPGPYALDQLVEFASPDDEAKWWASSRAQSNGINDEGQIIVRGDGQLGFFLTPITPRPSLSVNDLTINEGNNGTTTPGQFTVTLSELTGEDVVVPYEIVDGTASAGDDYTTSASSGLLTFAFSAGETSKTVQFTIVGDNTNESDETFVIQLGEAIGGAVVTKSEGTATIKNDDKKGPRK